MRKTSKDVPKQIKGPVLTKRTLSGTKSRERKSEYKYREFRTQFGRYIGKGWRLEVDLWIKKKTLVPVP